MVQRADRRIVPVLRGSFEFLTNGPFIVVPRTGRVVQAAADDAGGTFLAVVLGHRDLNSPSSSPLLELELELAAT